MIDVMVDDKGTQDVQPKPTQENLPKEAQNSRGSYAPLLFFVFASLLYMVLSIQIIDAKYVDFGDGNYLYLSWRLAEGEVLYQDLPSPQPPLHLFLGGALLWLTGGDPVLVRLWQVVQHVLIACCVVGIASRIFKNSAISFLAGTIYLFLPEGVWWAAGYQSEGLLILLQSFNVLLFLTAIEREKPSLALYGSAVTSALCCFVNMTALPYMALQWFFVWFRYRHSFYRYSTALIVPGLLLFGYMVFYSNGQYLEHVFNRQVGTYPTDSLWGMLAYFAEKLYTEGGDILYYEGGFVFAAMAGLFLFAGDEENEFAKDYTLWWGVFSIGSIIFVTKGGTVEYIFTLGEPAVAVFSSFFLVTLVMASDLSLRFRSVVTSAKQLGIWALLICLFLPALVMKPAGLLYMTFSNQSGPRGAFELDHEAMMQIATLIEYNCPEDKLVLTPPAYAFTAKRKIAQNASSTLILGIAYFNEWERFKKEQNTNIDLPHHGDSRFSWNFDERYYNKQAVFRLDKLFADNPSLREEYPIIALFLDLRRQISEGEIQFVMVNARHIFYFVPILHQAVQDYCYEIDPKIPLNFREEKIRFYKVK